MKITARDWKKTGKSCFTFHTIITRCYNTEINVSCSCTFRVTKHTPPIHFILFYFILFYSILFYFNCILVCNNIWILLEWANLSLAVGAGIFFAISSLVSRRFGHKIWIGFSQFRKFVLQLYPLVGQQAVDILWTWTNNLYFSPSFISNL